MGGAPKLALWLHERPHYLPFRSAPGRVGGPPIGRPAATWCRSETGCAVLLKMCRAASTVGGCCCSAGCELPKLSWQASHSQLCCICALVDFVAGVACRRRWWQKKVGGGGISKRKQGKGGGAACDQQHGMGCAAA